MRIIITFLIVLFSIQPVCFAGFSKDYAGTSTAQFLKLGAGARASGMGDAFVGISDDATAVYWNPAGLNQIENNSVSLMHAVWVEDIFYDWVSYAHPAGKAGVLGIGIQYLSYGDIREIDETGLEGNNFSPSDFATTISFAEEIYGTSFGFNMKYISSKIKKKATAFAIDIGWMHKIMDNKISLGLVFQNIGTKMKFVDEEDSLPINIRLGGAYKVRDKWIVSLDVSAPIDNEINGGIGVENNYKLSDNINIAWRIGYNTKTTDVGGLGGYSLGLGGNFKRYRVDYAFVPFGDLGDTHRISIGISF